MKDIHAWRARITVLVIAIGLVSLWSPTSSHAAHSAKLWSRWLTHDQNSELKPDHSVWGQFLDTFIRIDDSGATRLSYSGVRAADRIMLDAYIAYLKGFPIHRLIETIRDIDISPGWFTEGPWGAELATVDGQKISLNDIEQRILRPIWQDLRVHYAVNCAATGCPNLASQAFTGAEINAQLNVAARVLSIIPAGFGLRAKGSGCQAYTNGTATILTAPMPMFSITCVSLPPSHSPWL